MARRSREDVRTGELVTIAAILSAAGIAVCCAPSTTVQKAAAETALTAELLHCVDAAKTIAEAKACHDATMAKFTFSDGGAE